MLLDMMRHRQTAKAAALAVSLDAAKDHLGIALEDDGRDAEITALIKAATAAIETWADISIIETTWEGSGNRFADKMLLNRRPYLDMVGIEYVNADDGEIIAVAADVFHVVPDVSSRGIVYRGDGKVWPATVATRADAVRITYTSGFGADDTAVPDDVRQAIFMTVASMEANRGDCGCDGMAGIIPAGAQALLSRYAFRSVSVF